MRILHVSGDNIFVDNAYHLFELSFPESNYFLILTHDKKVEKVSSEVRMSILDADTHFKKPYKDFENFDIIVLHSLSYLNASWILNQKKREGQQIIWMLHGFEVHNSSKVKVQDQYSQKTLSYLGKAFQFKSGLKTVLRPLVELLVPTQNRTILNAAKKVDHLGILYEEEYEYVKKRFKLNANWLPFTYYPLEKIVSHGTGFVKGENILLGNSATESNNHFDVIDFLEKQDLKNRKVIVPLSYGNEIYRDVLIKYARQRLSDNFHPLTEFMPIEEYNKLLRSCSVALMNHYAQQAVGTVLLMVYLGSKVYLNRNNTLYSYLTRIGVKVFDIDKDLNNPDSLEPLHESLRTKNSDIISEQINEKKVVEMLQKCLK